MEILNFKEEIHRIPFVRIIIPLIMGILLQISFPFSKYLIINTLYLLLFTFATLSILFLFNKTKLIKNISDSIKYLLLFVFGIYLVNISYSKYEALQKQDISSGYIIAEISQNTSIKEKTIKAELDIKAIKNNDKWDKTEGKVIAYFEKDSLSYYLKFGDRILMEANFSEIEGPKNPDEFDYKQYMAFHLISKQSYLKSGSWKKLEQNTGSPIMLFASGLRERVLNIYSKYDIKNQEFAVLSALTLGYKDKLDAETKRSYSVSGAMHLLAVSGLHIGILFLILNYILFFIPDNKGWKTLKTIIIIVCLWTYALMIGLPTSAFRATVMFSIVSVGNSLNRKPNIYNSLAASAFILLVVNPFYITEVGFQLSYAAVAGIVFFQPKISSLVKVNNFVVKWIWEVIAVSIAAQIATAPLAIYYFHQFPNYFILTNIVVLPVSFLIIILSIFLISFSSLTSVSYLIAKIEIILLKFLNQSIEYIQELPYSYIPNISINKYQLWLLIIIVILIAFIIAYKHGKYLKYLLISLIAFYSIKAYRYYESKKQQNFIIYNIKNISAYNFIKGTNHIMLFNGGLDENKLNFHIKNNWIKQGIENEEIVNINNLENEILFLESYNKLKSKEVLYKSGIFVFSDMLFYLYKYKFQSDSKLSKKQVDYIIVNNNSPDDIKYIYSNFDFKTIIFDSSVSYYKLKKMQDECEKLGIEYYDIKNQGAFVLNL